MVTPNASFVQGSVETLTYSTSNASAITAGDILTAGNLTLVAHANVPVGDVAELAYDGGLYDVAKAAGTNFTQGDRVHVDFSTGLAVTSPTANSKSFGICTNTTVTNATAVRCTHAQAAGYTTTVAGSMTADDITGSDSSLGITGLAAAQGGAIALVGGTSSTSGNAGGAITRVGGTPGATGVGGAITDTGGAGGATSGAGGALSRTGGAGTAGNAAGGAISDTGGAGQGSAAGGALSYVGGAGGATGAGGAITITSGAGGATSGAAGAIAIAVGSATSGNGSAITITAGNGAGGTNSGGNLNLVAGAAVSTGTPGEVQVNGDANLILISEALTATDATRTVFVATRACRVKSIKEVHATASSSGTLQLEKCTGTTAPGSGTTLLTGTMSLAGTANTVVSGTLIATVASLTLAAGDRLSIVIAGTMTSLVGGRVTIGICPC